MVAIQKIGAQKAAIVVVVVDGDRQLGVAIVVPNGNAISKTSVVLGIVLVVVNVQPASSTVPAMLLMMHVMLLSELRTCVKECIKQN